MNSCARPRLLQPRTICPYSPVQHWTQGLARLANALVGGMGLRDAQNKEAQSWEDLANFQLGARGGASQPQSRGPSPQDLAAGMAMRNGYTPPPPANPDQP